MLEAFNNNWDGASGIALTQAFAYSITLLPERKKSLIPDGKSLMLCDLATSPNGKTKSPEELGILAPISGVDDPLRVKVMSLMFLGFMLK